MEILEQLTQAFGVSGRESKVREIIKRAVEPHCDEMLTDALGNLIVLKKGKGGGKRIMLSAHMDEIGMQVKKIEEDGRIRVRAVGHVWTAAVYNSTVVFQNGVVGVVGCVGNIEQAENKAEKLYIDIGCQTKEDTLKHVQVGDYCGFIGPYYELQNNHICSKSLDDRVGCYLLIEALKRNDGNRPNDVYYVFSVQEEVGCRGAVVSAERIKPDIGISVDVSPDHFYPSDLEGCNVVGEGVGVKLGDPSAMMDEYLVDCMLKCCVDNGIKFQRDVMDRGGTDSASMNKAYHGVRVAGVSVVDRYAHSQSSVVSKDDINAAIDLLDKYTGLEFMFENEN